MKFEIFTPIVIHELGQRDNQEDSVYPQLGSATDADRLFLVCDGMGGHEKGEVASVNVVDVMSTWIEQRTPHNGIVSDGLIKEALQHAYQRLDSLDNGAENKMGTTLTLVSLHRGGVAMAHIGDSRIYHVRPSQQEILYKSIDHSLVYELYRSGAITYDEMATSPHRNVITRAIMPGEENKDEIDIAHTTNVQPGDYFFLCSDGMLEEMTDDQLLNVLCQESSDVMKASTLVSMTDGNKDNHTALLIKIKTVVAESGDENLPNDEDISSYNEMASMLPVVDEANVVTEPVKHDVPPRYEGVPKVSTPKVSKPQMAAPQRTNAAKTSRSSKSGGINKTLLALVIILLLIVVAGAAYFLLNKNKSGKKNVADSDSPKTETSVNDNNNENKIESDDNTQESTQWGNTTSQGGNTQNAGNETDASHRSTRVNDNRGNGEGITPPQRQEPPSTRPENGNTPQGEGKVNPPIPGGSTPRVDARKKVEDILLNSGEKNNNTGGETRGSGKKLPL